MKRAFLLTAMSLATLTYLMPSQAQAWYCYHRHHHYYHHYVWVAPTINDVSVWWEHPYYYSSPYTVVDHYGVDPYWTFVGDPILVDRATVVGPYHYKPVPAF